MSSRPLSEGLPIVVFCLLTAVILLLPAWSKRRPSYPAAAYLIISGLLITVNRLSIFRFDRPTNIDEAQMAANAMRSKFGWLNWDLVDPVTSGPLNSMVLAWPYLLGADITMYTGRLTAAALAWACGCFAFMIGRQLGGLPAGILSSFPIFLFFGSTTYFQFVHYSSEHLPVFLLSAALYLLVRSFQVRGTTALVLAAFLLGLVPFAKLQAAPIAAAVGVVVLSRAIAIDLQARSHSWILVVVAATLPAVIFIAPLIATGEADFFLKSYFVQFGMRWEKIGHEAWYSRPLSMLADNFPISALIASSVSVAVLGMLSYRQAGSPPLPGIQRWLFAVLMFIAPIAFVSIAAPGHNYGHYLLLWIPMVVVLLALSCLLANAAMESSKQLGLIKILLLVIPMAGVGGTGLRLQANWLTNDAFLTGRALQAPHALHWLRPTKTDTLLCWGWQPECYVNAAITPATRFITNENQLYDTPLAPYFRSKFAEEFNAARPDFIVDGITENSFHFNAPEVDALPALPGFDSILAGDYAIISKTAAPMSCPRVYIRRDRKPKLDASRIEIVRIIPNQSAPEFSAGALDDGSVTESCIDYWLLPENQTGSVEFVFGKPSRVSTIALLNTRNGRAGDRASRDVEVTLMRGATVLLKERLLLDRFPYWSELRLTTPIEGVERAVISILSYYGSGGGLNEVKFYRD